MGTELELELNSINPVQADKDNAWTIKGIYQ